MKVYQAIQAVAAQMAKDGIAKSRENREQHFKFRGIDETLNALAPVLSQYGLVILPRIMSRTMTERLTQRGNPLFSVVVDAEFDFVSSEDGTKHTVKTFGEAMDTADKATNKAMSIAYKYAAFLAFCIPVEGMGEDADLTKHDVAPMEELEPTLFGAWVEMLQRIATTMPTVQSFREFYGKEPRALREWLVAHHRPALDAMVATVKANEEALSGAAQ